MRQKSLETKIQQFFCCKTNRKGRNIRTGHFQFPPAVSYAPPQDFIRRYAIDVQQAEQMDIRCVSATQDAIQ